MSQIEDDLQSTVPDLKKKCKNQILRKTAVKKINTAYKIFINYGKNDNYMKPCYEPNSYISTYKGHYYHAKLYNLKSKNVNRSILKRFEIIARNPLKHIRETEFLNESFSDILLIDLLKISLFFYYVVNATDTQFGKNTKYYFSELENFYRQLYTHKKYIISQDFWNPFKNAHDFKKIIDILNSQEAWKFYKELCEIFDQYYKKL